jgi:xanthine dehydrogenase YagT iron-sulfur-binding subunit
MTKTTTKPTPLPIESNLLLVNLTVNGQAHTVEVEPRTTLLDALREQLALTGTLKE